MGVMRWDWGELAQWSLMVVGDAVVRDGVVLREMGGQRGRGESAVRCGTGGGVGVRDGRSAAGVRVWGGRVVSLRMRGEYDLTSLQISFDGKLVCVLSKKGQL